MADETVDLSRRLLTGGLAALSIGGGIAVGADRGICRARGAYAGGPLHAPPPNVFAEAGRPFDGALAPSEVKVLEAAFREAADKLQLGAFTAAVARPGGGLWTAAVGPGSPPPERFFWASAGKAFTAATVLQLVEAGKLSLDDRLERWDPRFANAGQITIDDLLSHTSGLFSFQEDAGLRQTRGWKSPDVVLDVARKRPALFCPGATWSYSNTGYVLLGRIIEAVDGRPYAEAVTARVVERLGLTGTVIIPAGGVPSDIPTPATGDGTADDLRTPFAAGAVAASAPDMIRFWQGLFGGRLISTTSVQAQFARLYPLFDQTGVFYGRGVMLYDLPGGQDLWLGHSGGMPGLKTVAAYSTRRQAYVAVAFLGEASAEAVANLLLARLDGAT